MSQVGATGGEIGPEILEACRRGDREAFRALYEAYADRVHAIAFHFFHADADAAAEVTQQVFLKLMRDIVRFRGEAAFGTWLYRLVVNACVDRARRGARAPLAQDPAAFDAMVAPAASVEDSLSRRQVASSIHHAISALPARLRAVILLRYFEDLSYAEIARVLNCSPGTVASRLSRGHQLLARRLAALRAGWPREV